MLRSLLLALALALAAAAPAVAAEPASAVTGVTWQPGYRSWTAVAPSHRTDKGHLRLMLANPIMAKAYREGTLPFPDGSMIAKLVYQAVKSPEWDEAVVPGEAVTVELMVKDGKKYAATGGWGFGRFRPDGVPLGDEALYQTCFPCHLANVVNHDNVFTRWAP
ncbi:MAG: cytochrome P460 family protein [Deferrisomatales bacterium]